MRPDPYAWSLHPEALAGLLALVALYVLVARRWRVSVARAAAFAAAAALLAAVTLGPLESLTFHLLTAHLLQNIVLAEWVPLLLLLALPPALTASATRFRLLRALTHPLVALPLWLGTYFLWHLPPAYDAALRNPATLLHAEHLSYLLTGLLLWWPVVVDEPWRLGPAARAAYVVAAFVLSSPLGLLLALLPDTIYGFYAEGTVWEPLLDQQIAGITMSAEEAIVFSLVFGYWFARFLRDEERREAEAPAS